MRSSPLSLVFGVLASGVALTACAGGPPPAALENRVFYPGEDQAAASSGGVIESPYPPLDKAAKGDAPAYTGVGIFANTVHLSRPANWRVRRASVVPGHRFIEYVSPNEYLFSVYEVSDFSASDGWKDMLDKYEKDVKAKGAEVVGQRIPVATFNAQGREFIVKRTVKGQRAPYIHLSSETLLRGEKHVELVQVVHQGESLAPIGGELLRVMETLDVR